MKSIFAPLALAALVSTVSMPASAADKAMTRAEVETIVKEYILANPEVVLESLNKMQEREYLGQMKKAKENITARKSELFEQKGDPVAGNPKGNVTLVEFFDYNCGYCKKMLGTVIELLKEDSNVKVIFKEFPILSPTSELASRASLSVYSLKPEKYFDFHTAVMHLSGNITQDALNKIAESVGISADELQAEMKKPEYSKMLQANHELASSIGITGTPALVIGDELIPGAVPLEALRTKIKAYRAKK